jgi:3-oxoadipate enol-lactonase
MEDRQFVDVSGRSFAYRQAGSPAPIPVVMLHGLGSDADTWAPLVAALPDRWTIALDQRGHGQSPWFPDYQLPHMADDLAAVLNALDVATVDLVAHSMGAMVAYIFASRSPDRVRRLVLEEPGPPEPSSPRRVEGSRPEGELGYDWAFQAPFSRQRNYPDPAWSRDLVNITAPTLIMTGVDSHIPPDGAARMAERIPDCRCVSYPAGHEIHGDLSDEFIRDVVNFLSF